MNRAALTSILILVFFSIFVWSLTLGPVCIPDGVLVQICERPNMILLSVLGAVLLALYLWIRGGDEYGEEEDR